MLNLFEFEYYCDLTNYIVKRNANFIPNVDLAIMAYVCPYSLKISGNQINMIFGSF